MCTMMARAVCRMDVRTRLFGSFLPPCSMAFMSSSRKAEDTSSPACTETQAAGADTQLAEPEFFHHGLVNRHSHEDHVGAVPRQADKLLPLLQREAPEALQVPGDARRAQACRFDLGAVKGFKLGLHAGENGRRAAHAYQLHVSS